MGDGILPFALRDQVRFVRTWSSTLYGALRANRCVRPYMAGTHVRRKKGKVLTYRGVLSAGVWYTRLNKSEVNGM